MDKLNKTIDLICIKYGVLNKSCEESTNTLQSAISEAVEQQISTLTAELSESKKLCEEGWRNYGLAYEEVKRLESANAELKKFIEKYFNKIEGVKYSRIIELEQENVRLQSQSRKVSVEEILNLVYEWNKGFMVLEPYQQKSISLAIHELINGGEK